jgi:hypothetical protein
MTTYDTEQGGRATPVRAGDGGGEGSGFFDDPGIGYGRRPWSRTKPFFLTSEFLVLAVIVAAIAIAMGVLDNFDAPRGWLLITIIGAAYMAGEVGNARPDPEPARSGSRPPLAGSAVSLSPGRPYRVRG